MHLIFPSFHLNEQLAAINTAPSPFSCHVKFPSHKTDHNSDSTPGPTIHQAKRVLTVMEENIEMMNVSPRPTLFSFGLFLFKGGGLGARVE